MVSVKLLYFSWLQDQLGKQEEDLTLADLGIKSPTNVRAILKHLAASQPSYEAAFTDLSRLKVAINQNYASFDEPVHDQDEIAIFPPATGG